MRGYWQVEGDLSPEAARLAGDSVTEAEAQGKTLIVIDGVTLRWVPPLDSLDAAWAEAEAAKDERAAIELFGPVNGRYAVQLHGDHWLPGRSAGGDSPAAALRALAAKLREVGR